MLLFVIHNFHNSGL